MPMPDQRPSLRASACFFFHSSQPISSLRHLQHLRIVARVVHAAVGRGVRKFFRPNVVAQAHFVGGNAQFVRADVHHALQKPEMLHARVAAVRADRALVGDRLPEVDAGVLEAVHAGETLATRSRNPAARSADKRRSRRCGAS